SRARGGARRPRGVRRHRADAGARARREAAVRPGRDPEPRPLRGGLVSGAASNELASLYAGTLDCVHCGLCLPACPTYKLTGRETSSPRGRVYLIRSVAGGRRALVAALADEASFCLGCRACETACPSGVRFGALLEGTRAAVEAKGLRTGFEKRVEAFALREMLTRPRRLAWAFGALAFAQRSGLGRLASL